MTTITLRYPPDAPVIVSIINGGLDFQPLELETDGAAVVRMTKDELLVVQSDALIMDFVKWLREKNGNEK